MTVRTINGVNYKLPSGLNEFQISLYVHLINWKWRNLTKEPGIYRFKRTDRKTKVEKEFAIEYDAILPDYMRGQWKVIYPPIVDKLKELKKKFPFKAHTHIDHMASSQAANMNLFIPILLSPNVNSILRELKPDFETLAREYLYNGFRIEYWDEVSEAGLLGDHSKRSGTDADIAIAYYNTKNELCLWLIEHKLTEVEFTTCGGYKSNGRNEELHKCESSFSEIIANKNLCYYSDVRGYNYWDLTDKFQSIFPNHLKCDGCPFKGGMNQLWRNQLMGLAVEDNNSLPFTKVFFSVVRHPENESLNKSMDKYEQLIGGNQIFFRFTSSDFLESAAKHADRELWNWIFWYRELYNIENVEEKEFFNSLQLFGENEGDKTYYDWNREDKYAMYIDTTENAIDSLETCLHILERKDNLKWKWVAFALHHSLYSFSIAALENGNYENVLEKDPRDIWTVWFGNNKPKRSKKDLFFIKEYPKPAFRYIWEEVDIEPPNEKRSRENNEKKKKEKLIGFWTALARIQDDFFFMGRLSCSKAVKISDPELELICWLTEMVRNDLTHFIPKGYTIGIYSIIEASKVVIRVIEDLVFNSYTILFVDHDKSTDRIKLTVDKIKEILEQELRDIRDSQEPEN